MLITAPSESERLFEMSVRMARAEMQPMPGYTLLPWVAIRANTETGEITLAAGIKAKKAHQ